MPDLKEACGVFGVYAPGEDVARVTFYGLYALQHRGQESAGIATYDRGGLQVRLGMGLVSQVFEENDLASLRGNAAIGHTRYSTTGSSRIENAQPLVATGPYGTVAVAHNGNLINAGRLREDLEEGGVRLTSTTDSEVIAHMLVRTPGKDWVDRLAQVMKRIEGAYSLVVLVDDEVIGARDQMGVRPMCMGRMGEGWVFASESCALDHLGAAFVRDLQPGEIVSAGPNGFRTLQALERRDAACIFEHIYFARPDSQLGGEQLYPVRMRMGAQLARQHPVEADIVMGVPDSAIAAAIGYAHESGIPFVEGFVKNRYVGRTFIQPDQRIREQGVALKYNPLPHVLNGKRVIVVDDSIVRGTTTPRVVQLLRRAGATEVHLRICAPPITNPCHFGVDMATRTELIAAQMSVEAIRQHVGADTLGYLSVDDIVESVGTPRDSFCLACFTGEYPIPVQLEMDKLMFEPEAEATAQTPAPTVDQRPS